MEMENSSVMKIEVEKFDGKKDFGLWRKRIETFLIQHDLDQALLRVEKKQKMTSDEWNRMDKKAGSMILFSLLWYHMIEETISISMWKKLDELYMAKNVATNLYQKQQLYGLWMKGGTSLLEHLRNYNKTVIQLAPMGSKIEDDDKVDMIIIDNPRITMDEVKAILLTEEFQWRQGAGDESGSGAGLIADL
ncbi:uncharacterized protein LOC109829737 [Asparagus officinalis]|uniref:uncharacterized protein LOC109829737 n=1 Tax=Asparagus officinalis TaxID=4686 RepID=UPI00098DFC53|nr:uncharacterized protein LOC109829737 [Asparagus officinalis]